MKLFKTDFEEKRRRDKLPRYVKRVHRDKLPRYVKRAFHCEECDRSYAIRYMDRHHRTFQAPT